MRLIILISIFVFVSIGYCNEEVENNREKRSYYGGYDMYGSVILSLMLLKLSKADLRLKCEGKGLIFRKLFSNY